MFVCSRITLIRSFTWSLHRLWISLLIEFGSKTIKPNTTKNKFIRYLCFIADFIHSCHHCLKMSSLSLEKNRLRSIDLTPLAINVTSAFTIVNCLEHELLEGFSVQGWQQSLKIFSILSNILDLECCLSNRWKIHSSTGRHVYLPRWQGWRT